jgi:hypothetical protein
MPSTYTVNLGIEKPATGEQSGTWGDTTNVNFDIVDQAINGVLSLTLASAGTSGSPNTLTIDNGATSDGRNKWIEFVDGGDLGANAYVQLDPNDAEKIVFFRNSLSGSRSVFVFQGTYNAANDFEIPAGYDVVLKFDGGGASATVTDVFQKLRVTELYTPTLGAGTADINDGTVEAVIGGTTPKAGTFTTLTANTNLTVNASTTVDGIIDDDTMATASATKLSTSESIKAYVDSQVGTVDTLSEILANGNTSGANNLIIDNGQAITTNTVNETTAGSGVTVDSVLLKDDGINATNLEITNIKANDGTAAGSIANSTGAVTITSFISNSVDIGGGAIDGTTIGGTTPNSGAFTTLSATGDLTVDTNTLYVDSTNNRIGVGTSSPAAKLHVTSASSGVTPNTTGDELFVEGSGDSGITIGSGTASQGRLFFGDSGFATAGRVGYNHADNSLYFGTNGVAERMRIDSSGNVGIGTASPLSAAGYSWLTINGASSGGVVSLSNAGTELGRLQSNILATTLSTLTVAPLVFKTNNAEWMRISSAGLVGIGTSSPSAKLTVNGDSEINSLTIGRGAGNNNTNTVFGNSAFGNNTTGVNNTAVGYQSLYSNTTGSQNTTTGREALRNNTTGANNIAVGGSALYSNTTGGSNTATGFRSLYSNTTGANNTATGNQSLYSNTTGANNDSVGYQSLYSNTTGGGNTATGNQSLYSNTTGANNTAVGMQSLYSNTTGAGNTATGREALYNNTIGFSNTTVGYQSLYSNTTGTYNTATAREALSNNTTGGQNTAAGYKSLYSNTTGSNNTATGSQALSNNTTAGSNTAVGMQSLYSNTTGAGNTATGREALYNNTTGSFSIAVGYQSLYSNTTGSNNTATGMQSLYSNTTGNNNTATGREALRNNTTGSSNVAVGYQSFYSNTTGANNTAVGFLSLYSNTTGTQNNATGREALRNNTTGNYNDSVGYQSLYSNTTGASNTAVGLQSLYSNTTGASNIAVGFQSLYSNTEGDFNTAAGRQALRNNTTGELNVSVGYQSLYNNTTGSNNTATGFAAGDIITTGSRNVIIGQGTDPSAEDGIDQIVVGYSLTGKGNDTAYVGGTNGAYNEKNVTTWETTSDERIKKNIKDNNTGLDILSQIQVRNFEYRTPDEITNLPSHAAIEKDGVQLGVIAQEIQKVLPECVSENSTGVLSVNTDPLVWYLINAVKELKAEIQALKGN